MCISGLISKSSNSSFWMRRSPSLSWTSRISSRLAFRKDTAAWFLSWFVTFVTTSQMIPISMFRRVKLLRNMKIRKSKIMSHDSARISVTLSDTASRKVPWISSTHIDSPTFGNVAASLGWPSACVLKMMPKTYVRTMSSTTVTATERKARVKPLMSVITSGTSRRSRATRPILVSRRSRSMRRTDRLPMAGSDTLLPDKSQIGSMTQVSPTMSTTRTKSKQNQGSVKHRRRFFRAQKRMMSSIVKDAPKVCSTT
mmetsp:Transcript_3631/g.8351  ORF Transcript_3631/g.8351 Transcript_3631/m.8351 type:complete len:255 (+) Transcript_3631:651-1415(+)